MIIVYLSGKMTGLALQSDMDKTIEQNIALKKELDKANEEIQERNCSSFDFVMQYENGKYKCKYKSGKEFESVDGKTWKEIVLPKESE